MDGPYYAYQLRGEKIVIEFWILPPPQNSTANYIPAEIATVVERPSVGGPTILWPPKLRSIDVEAAKK
jgi:hypothetical protein